MCKTAGIRGAREVTSTYSPCDATDWDSCLRSATASGLPTALLLPCRASCDKSLRMKQPAVVTTSASECMCWQGSGGTLVMRAQAHHKRHPTLWLWHAKRPGRGGEETAVHSSYSCDWTAHRSGREVALEMRQIRILGHHGPGVAYETPPSPVDRSRIACYPVSLTGHTLRQPGTVACGTSMVLLRCACPEKRASSGMRRRTASASEV